MHPRRIAHVVVIATLVLLSAATGRAQWVPPIGIPQPAFGIVETAPALPNPWTTDVPGFYYVDYSTGSDARAYGHPGAARQTIPLKLPAGSVVQLVGSYPFHHSSPYGITASGTPSQPVFIRGTSASVKPYITNNWEIKGTYFVLEYLEFGDNGTGTQTGNLYVLSPASYGAVRHCDVHGNLNGGGLGVLSWDTNTTSQIVVWDNDIHDNGDVNASYDQDVHGIAVSARVSYLWIVDNRIARNSGDGVQINAGSLANQSTTHHVFLGRNVSHHNKQTGMWTKQANDVIFSQNVSYGHRPSNSSDGAGMGFQYAPDRVWFLFNRIYDCEYGIVSGSDSGLGSGKDSYYVGNVIYNIHPTQTVNPNTAWSQSGVMLAGGINHYIVANTIWDTSGGINTPNTTGSMMMADNIITSTDSTLNHVFIEMGNVAAASTLQHNLFLGTARIKWGTGTAVNLATFQAQQGSKGAYSLETSDVKFVDPTTADFHLTSLSPARGQGIVDSVYSTFYTLYGIDIRKDAAALTLPGVGQICDVGAYQFTVSSTGSSAPLAPRNVTIR